MSDHPPLFDQNGAACSGLRLEAHTH
jgi:hypothetical protein